MAATTTAAADVHIKLKSTAIRNTHTQGHGKTPAERELRRSRGAPMWGSKKKYLLKYSRQLSALKLFEMHIIIATYHKNCPILKYDT